LCWAPPAKPLQDPIGQRSRGKTSFGFPKRTTNPPGKGRAAMAAPKTTILIAFRKPVSKGKRGSDAFGKGPRGDCCAQGGLVGQECFGNKAEWATVTWDWAEKNQNLRDKIRLGGNWGASSDSGWPTRRATMDLNTP